MAKGAQWRALWLLVVTASCNALLGNDEGHLSQSKPEPSRAR